MTWVWVALMLLGLYWVLTGAGLFLWGACVALWHLLFGVPGGGEEW